MADVGVDAEWVLSDKKMNEALGAEVQKAREAAGLSRPDLATRLPFDVAVATLLNWEKGHRAISYARLVETARVLGTTAPALLARAIERVECIESLMVQLDLTPLCDAAVDDRYSYLHVWAVRKRAALDDSSSSIVAVHHTMIREFAVMLDVHVKEVVVYLSVIGSFVPGATSS